MNLGTAHVIRADARDLPLADDSVDLIVTSPPYFGLRSYTDAGEHYAGQIGSEPSPQEFLDALIEVTAECARVLKPTGSMWVNLGDKYSDRAGPSWAGSSDRLTGRPSKPARSSSTSMAPRKSLLGLPWRYAIRCIDDLGLILREEIIWSKPNGLPESVTDRARRSHEQWFHFTLRERYFAAVDEIREPHTGGTHRGRSDGAAPPGGKQERQVATGQRGGTLGGTNPDLFDPRGKLPGSVWTIPSEPLRVPDHLGIDHFAAFPTEWPKRLIVGWSPNGVCVACGAGIAPVVSKQGGRPVARAHRHLPGYADPAGEGTRDMSYRIEGYRCSCPPKSPTSTVSARTTAPNIPTTPGLAAAAADGSQGRIRDATVPARPAVVLDPFGGTGTVALVAKALGRTGITVDMSADYCRLAEWRTNDRDQLAKILGIAKAGPVQGDDDLLGLLEAGA